MLNIIIALAKRLLFALPVVWAVVTLVFLLIHIVPGDPVRNKLGDNATEQQVLEQKRELGLDLPLSLQYINYWRGVLKGDLGVSLNSSSDRVLEKILRRYPATIELAFAGLAFAILIAVPLGVTAGTNQGKLTDNIASVVALLGISTPGFVLGPLMIYLFAETLNLLPASGRYGPEYLIPPVITAGSPLAAFLTHMVHLILPAITMGAPLAAFLTRMVRSSVIEEMNEDYVRTARAKGLNERQVVYKHVLKNGLIPVITVIGLQFGVLLAGAIITERIFNWPGLGSLTLEAISSRDYPLVQGCILMIALTYIIANLLTDFAYRLLDPRIKVE
jgi:peptide/nickel transport system permease protein